MNLITRTVLILTCCTMSQTTFAQFIQNQAIAHRGAWKEQNLPQNSIASLQRAIELGCAGTEFDVHLTKDNVLVVNHDDDFYGLDIATSTYQELLTRKHPNGESIPTAEAYLRAGMKQHKTKLIFELKTSPLGQERTLEAANQSVALIKQLQASDWVEYILFDYEGAKRVASLDPQAKVYYLNGDVSPEQAKKDGFYGLDYHFSVYRKNPDWIQHAHNLGLVVNAWTVNTAEEMRHSLDQHVEYITTDEPELLLDVIANHSSPSIP